MLELKWGIILHFTPNSVLFQKKKEKKRKFHFLNEKKAEYNSIFVVLKSKYIQT